MGFGLIVCKRLANQICAWICFECLQKDLGSSMCGYWVLLHFSLFASAFVASKPIKDTNFPSFSATKRKKRTKHRKRQKSIRKDDPNQLSINEINALQAEQSNWGEKKKESFRLPLLVLCRRQWLCCFVFFF